MFMSNMYRICMSRIKGLNKIKCRGIVGWKGDYAMHNRKGR